MNIPPPIAERAPHKYGQFLPSFCAKCKTQFLTNYATIICRACQDEPKEYGVIEFLPGGSGQGMINHGQFHTLKEAEARANAVRYESNGHRVTAFKLSESAALLD